MELIYLPDKVKVLRGKYKGHDGWFCCFIERHPLSPERRAQIRVYGGNGPRTLLLNESGYQVVTEQEYPHVSIR